MAKQTSRMYGIKVKEKVNYYEFGANDGFITLFYLSDVGSGAWQVKVGKHDGTNPKSDVEWWYNGVKYEPGDTIETFNDGDIVTFHILESHVDTIPYVNYMYDIYGNAGENIEYGNKEVFYRILPSPVSQYACKVYMFENGMVKSTKEFTSEDIVKYKQTYSQIVDNPLYPVYNMLFDWHGADPHSGYPQMSFQAISNSNYIKYNGNTISKNETIKTWQAIGFTGFEVKDDTNKYTAQKKTAEALPMVQLCKRIGGAFICQATKDKKNIFSDVFHDHKDVYYNGHYHKAMYLVYDNPGVDGCWKRNVGSLALTYAYPYWFLMSIKAGIEYGGRTYEARKLIRSWKPSDSVDMTLKEKESRAKENHKDINKVVYDITKTANVDSITVIMQEIDDNRQYTDLDTRTFTSAESPVTFHSIQFKFETTKWTIISKCGYIRYNGRTYPNNRTILSFNLDEDVHIEIGDETNKYFVETEITYIVKTPNTDVSAIYSVHTSEMEKTLKIVKQIGDKEEPWVTVRFYEAMYIPVEYDDIAVRFDNTAMKWELYSNSDNLYHDGTNYKKGTLLSEWLYNVFVKIGNIVVTHENHEALEVTKIEKSNTNKVSNQNIDEDINWHKADSIDFHISYNYTNSVWTLRAVKDCWMNGIHLMNGDIIKQWKTGSFVDEFTFLFAYHDDEDHPELITNVVYHVSAAVDFKKVTTVSVSLYGHPTESFSDKDISKGSEINFLFTKQDARSMYGYIWQKEETPPPPVWSFFYLLYTEFYWGSGIYNKYGSLRFIDDRDLQNINSKKDLQMSGWRWNPYRVIWYEYSFLNRVFISYEYYAGTHWLYICDNISDNNPNFVLFSSFETDFWISFIKNQSTIIGKKRNDVSYYYEYTIFSDHTVSKTLEKYIPDILSEYSEFLYACNYSSGLFIKEFGNKVIYYADDRNERMDNFEVFVYDPYNNTMDEYLVWFSEYQGIPELKSYMESISWQNYDRNNIQPSDVGKTNSYVSYDNNPIGQYSSSSLHIKDYGWLIECSTYKKFFFNNAFYSYGIIYQSIREVRVNYDLGYANYYEAEIDYKEFPVIIKITPNETSLKFMSELTDYYIRPKGLQYNSSHGFLPDSYFLFYAGGYYFGNTKYFVGQKVNKIYNPKQGRYEYEYLNIYGIFRFNTETEIVEKVKEINGINTIYINKIDMSTGESVGTEKFYYGYNDNVSENDHWIFYQTTQDGGNYSALHDYEGTECGAFTGSVCSYVNVSGSLVTATKDKFIFRIKYSNKFLYVVFDNPEFNPSVGNYCFYVDPYNY